MCEYLLHLFHSVAIMITWHITIIMLLFLWLTVLQLYFWFILISMWMISSTYPLKYFQLKNITTVQAQSICNFHKDYTDSRRSLVFRRTSPNCPRGIWKEYAVSYGKLYQLNQIGPASMEDFYKITRYCKVNRNHIIKWYL